MSKSLEMPAPLVDPPQDAPDDLPECLRVENRKPLDAEAQARVDAFMAPYKAKVTAEAATEKAAKDERVAKKREYDRLRRLRKQEAKEAVESGATKAMPLEGKDAIAAIKAARVTPGALGERAAKAEAEKRVESEAGKRKRAVRKVETAKLAKAGTKLDQIVVLLRRKEGCTTADVLQATGWPSVSMPAQAKAAGLTLRQEKEGRATRYWAA